jgi:hypothetical protein
VNPRPRLTRAAFLTQIDYKIEVARAKWLPKSALASYGISYRAAGQLSAKQVPRILEGNALGLTISQSLLTRADEVIQ